jgi:hypothetical protein
MTPSRRNSGLFQERRKRSHVFPIFLLLATTLTTTGCGGGNVARPTGQVVDRGVPVERAAITFSAEADDRVVRVSGLTDADGRYRLDYGVHEGLPVGSAEVTIGRALLKDGSPAPPGEEGMHLLQTGEAKLRTYEYEVELSPGSPSLDFDLADGDLPR